MAGPTEKCKLSELCYPETLNVPLPTQIYIYSKLRKNYLLDTGFKLPDLIGCESKAQVVVSPSELSIKRDMFSSDRKTKRIWVGKYNNWSYNIEVARNDAKALYTNYLWVSVDPCIIGCFNILELDWSLIGSWTVSLLRYPVCSIHLSLWRLIIVL